MKISSDRLPLTNVMKIKMPKITIKMTYSSYLLISPRLPVVVQVHFF